MHSATVTVTQGIDTFGFLRTYKRRENSKKGCDDES